jgi:hypothetical protein
VPPCADGFTVGTVSFFFFPEPAGNRSDLNWKKTRAGPDCADGVTVGTDPAIWHSYGPDTVGTARPSFFLFFANLASFAQKIAQNAHIIGLNMQ